MSSVIRQKSFEFALGIRLLQESDPVDIDVTKELGQVEELIRILTAIVKTTSAGAVISKLKT